MDFPPSRISSERRLARDLNIRWVSGLALLAVLILAGFLIFLDNMRWVEAGASSINEAGRQRMLSQRAALLARQLADLPVTGAEAERDPIRLELRDIARRMESVHRGLQAGAPLGRRQADLWPELEGIFAEAPHRLDGRCREFVAAVASLAEDKLLDSEALERVVEIAEDGALLAGLDAVVVELERHTKRGLSRSRTALIAVTLATLAVLGMLAMTVFRPMVKTIRRHLERLREQSEELRLTLDSALTSIAVVDPSGRLVTVNRFLCELTGRLGGELIGTRWLDLVHPENRAEARELLRDLLAGEIRREARPLRLVTRSGEVRRGLVRCGVQHDDRGEPVRLVIHFEDSTDRLRAEEEARQSRERLAHLSRVTAMGEMAGGIAHEINQPLTAIATYAQACRRLAESGRLGAAELLSTLEKIGGQALRAGEVIKRLRAFVGRKQGGAEVVDVNAVIREAVALARADTRMRHCEIELALSPGLEPVIADPIQLEQVLLNLILNGIEAQAEVSGTQTLSISTASAPDQEAVEVAVADRGRGLPEKPEKLFEPFYSTKSSGMGMGLSISRTLVASHGGKLWCVPRTGGGAVFLFSLPTAVEGRRRAAG